MFHIVLIDIIVTLGKLVFSRLREHNILNSVFTKKKNNIICLLQLVFIHLILQRF